MPKHWAQNVESGAPLQLQQHADNCRAVKAFEALTEKLEPKDKDKFLDGSYDNLRRVDRFSIRGGFNEQCLEEKIGLRAGFHYNRYDRDSGEEILPGQEVGPRGMKLEIHAPVLEDKLDLSTLTRSI